MKGLLEHWGTWCEEVLEGQEEVHRLCAPGARAIARRARAGLGDLCEEGCSSFYGQSAGASGNHRVHNRLPT